MPLGTFLPKEMLVLRTEEKNHLAPLLFIDKRKEETKHNITFRRIVRGQWRPLIQLCVSYVLSVLTNKAE